MTGRGSVTERRRGGAPPSGGWIGMSLHLAAVTYLAAHVFLAAWVVVPVVARGFELVVIVSGSMEPSLSPGDVVLLDSQVREPPVGAVVTFEDATGRLVTHRAVGLDEAGSIVTKGDANEDRDGATVPMERVVGVGRLAVPFAGLPSMWLREAPAALGAWLVATTAVIALTSRTRPSKRSLAGTIPADVGWGGRGPGGASVPAMPRHTAVQGPRARATAAEADRMHGSAVVPAMDGRTPDDLEPVGGAPGAGDDWTWPSEAGST